VTATNFTSTSARSTIAATLQTLRERRKLASLD
jgi:hypothetical protein